MENFKYEKNYSEGGKEVTGYYIFGATAEGKRAAELTVPSNHEGLPVVGIDSFALSYRGKLEKLTVSEGIRWILPSAFSECRVLREVKLPSSLERLGADTFLFCKSLKEIYIPNRVKAIHKSTFFGCKSLELAVIGDSVTEIGKDAFWCCKNLKTVSLPAALTHVEKDAFYECNALTDVYFGGSEEAWEKISIEGNNECLRAAKVHFLSKYRAADFDDSYNTKDV